MRVKITKRGSGSGRNHYELHTIARPSDADVARAQAEVGFDQHGYGAPMNVVTVEDDLGEFVTTWESWANSD